MVYKLVSKMIVNRMKKSLWKCVSEEQSAFMEGKFVLDNDMIAIEIIHMLLRERLEETLHS